MASCLLHVIEKHVERAKTLQRNEMRQTCTNPDFRIGVVGYLEEAFQHQVYIST